MTAEQKGASFAALEVLSGGKVDLSRCLCLEMRSEVPLLGARQLSRAGGRQAPSSHDFAQALPVQLQQLQWLTRAQATLAPLGTYCGTLDPWLIQEVC